jgi:hypothetical protein
MDRTIEEAFPLSNSIYTLDITFDIYAHLPDSTECKKHDPELKILTVVTNDLLFNGQCVLTDCRARCLSKNHRCKSCSLATPENSTWPFDGAHGFATSKWAYKKANGLKGKIQRAFSSFACTALIPPCSRDQPLPRRDLPKRFIPVAQKPPCFPQNDR